MKLTKINMFSLVALAGLALSSTSVLAAEAGSTSTPTNITLEKGDDTGGETDPIIPIDPLDPPAGGSLRIDAASAFNFGSLKLGSAISKDVVVPKDQSIGVQVTDFRGSGDGWALTAKIDDLKGKKVPTNILKASISIPKGKISTTADGDMQAPAVAVPLTLSKAAAPVMTAKKNNGLGIWANDFNGLDGTVTIKVPTNAYIDQYSANITWSLQDAPM